MSIRFLSGVNIDSNTLFVDSTNNRVGIGTASPSYSLDVNGVTRFQSNVRFANNTWNVSNDGFNRFYFATDNRTYFGSGGGYEWRKDNDTAIAVLTNDGNLGIGTTAPNSKLDVRGVIEGGDGTIRTVVSYTGSGGVTGTITNHPYILYANNDERMRITAAGNVGIGTTSPSGKLSVVGQTTMYNGASNALYIDTDVLDGNTRDAIYLFEDDGQANGRQAISWYNGNQSYYKARIWTEVGGSYAATTFGIDVADDARNVATRLAIRNGNVGIGTTSPTSKLDVYNTSNAEMRISTASEGYLLLGQYTNGGFIGTSSSDATAGVLRLGTAGTERARITAGGNVGIGTTAPSQKLEVSGNILATSFIKSGGTSSEYLMADGSVSTTSNVAPRYVQTINVSQTAYTTICTVTGGSLASAVNMSFQGTSGNVVVNVTAQILVNHFQDISITTTSGFYSQLNIRVISNNNETYSVEAQVISAVGASTDLNIEVFPLNSESVTFGGSPVTPGTTLVHTTRQGLYVSASEPMSISSGSDIYAAGNVGIGTTSPSAKLVVIGAAGKLYIDDSGVGYNYYDASNAHNFRDFAGTSRLYINTGTGNVGIGTTAPSAKLDITSTNGDHLRLSYNSSYYWELGREAADGRLSFTDSQNGERVTISTAGNVGIGTTAPQSIFEVAQSTPTISITSTIAIESTTNNQTLSQFIFYKHYGLAQGAKIAMLQSGGTANYPQAHLAFFTNDGSGGWSAPSERMRIKDNGNVGIGTTSPAVKLHVAGTSETSVRVSDSGGSYMELYQQATDSYILASNALIFYNGGSERMRITSAGNVGIGTTSPSFPLSVAGKIGGTLFSDSHLEFLGSGNTILKANNDVVIGYSQSFYVTQGGNVGIGTTSPGYKLHVNSSADTDVVAVSTSNTNSAVLSTFNSNASSGNFMQLRSYGAGTSGTILGASIAKANMLWSNNDALMAVGTIGATPLILGTQNAERLRITSAGNVGIGTTSPSGLLHVNKQTGVTSFTSSTFLQTVLSEPNGQGTEYVGIDFTGYSSAFTGKPLARIAVLPTGSGTVMSFGTSNSYSTGVTNQAMVINYDGNVGIGTTSPAKKLHVYNAGPNQGLRVSNLDGVNMDVLSGANGGIVGTNSNHPLSLYTNSTEKVTITAAGNVGIGNTLPNYPLHVKGGSVKFESQSNLTGFFKANTTQCNISFEDTTNASNDIVYIGSIGNNFMIATNYDERVRVNSSGNLGIATTNPTAKLHVNGTVRMDNAGNTFTTAYTPSGGNTVSDVVGNNTDGRVLGTPDIWLRVNIAGTNYVFPGYTET